jgi:hypothetical protein
MDKYDIQLLQFHRKWHPFGGPSDDDIFVEFGLTRVEFIKRIETARRLVAPGVGQGLRC